MGEIRQRAHPQWLRQRGQNHHATQRAQGRTGAVPVGLGVPPAWAKPARHRSGSSKAATEGESSGDEFGILEDDRCFDTGVFQRRHLVHELVFACSPPPPPRLPAQPYFLESSRLVCRSRSGPMRAGAPPSHQDRGPECFGTDRSLRRSVALQPGHRKETTFRSEGLGWCGPAAIQIAKHGLLAVSLSPQQPFPSSPIFRRGVSGKERSAGRQVHCATWTPVSLRGTLANRVSDLPRH